MSLLDSRLAALRERFEEMARAPALHGWSPARVEEWLCKQRETFATLIQPAEVVALPLANTQEAVFCLLLLLERGATCLVLPADAALDEQRRLLAQAGGGRAVTWSGAGPDLAGSLRLGFEWSTPSILLPTSGSTGSPKQAFRSLDSLLLEGDRYARGLGLGPGDHVLIPAPISHAYALGWLVAALLAGCTLTLVPPTHLDATIRHMANGAPWVVLTPSLARLLSRRRMPHGVSPDFGPLRAMVGAGPVDAALEQAFRDRFHVGLFRNYGSSETGAVLMGGPGLPDGCVGTPPPGVAARVVNVAGESSKAGETGHLLLALEDGTWRDSGDLASSDDLGQITIRGRTSQSVRRGERWISPHEIERVAAAEPGVRSARATGVPGRRTGDDLLLLEIWPDAPARFDLQALHTSLRARLPASHWPDEIRIRGRLRRTESGKIRAGPRYYVPNLDSLLAAARAYKRSELLFALLETGVLEQLDGALAVDDHAAALGIDPVALEVALEQAERLGIVAECGRTGSSLDGPKRRILDLERLLSVSWTTRRQIAETLRSGFERRPLVDPASLRALYAGALHGEVTRFRARLGLRRARVGPGARLLEVTAGPGDYLNESLSRWPDCSGRLWQVGDLSGAPHPALGEPIRAGKVVSGPPANGERFTACVVFNAIHGHEAARDLARLLSLVEPGGVFLVDDLFLGDDATSAEFGVDWLTHGGVSFQTAEELRERLAALGGSADILDVPGSLHARHVFVLCGGPA